MIRPNMGTQTEFRSFAMQEVQAILALLAEKGDQYSQDSIPALSNFFECAAVLDISPQLDLMTVAQKHWHILCKWASGRRDTPRKQLRERIRDVIVYMLLLLFMLADGDEQQGASTGSYAVVSPPDLPPFSDPGQGQGPSPEDYRRETGLGLPPITPVWNPNRDTRS